MKNEVLLQQLSQMGSNGRAESERDNVFCRMFYPAPEQMGALDPDVSLVLGARGSGKTALFRAVTQFGLSKTLKEIFPSSRIPEKCKWAPIEILKKKVAPDETRLRSFFESTNLVEDEAHDFWQCILIRELWADLDDKAHIECLPMKDADTTIPRLLEAGRQCGERAAAALDRLDDRLEAEASILFVGYDDLDLLVTLTGRAASSLVGFWATRSRRWRGIRAKLFLRSDIYRRFIVEGGPDLAKISANRYELNWSDESLLGLLVKRVLNQDIGAWQAALALKNRDLIEDPVLGFRQISGGWEDYRRVVHSILGKYMGAGPKKGASETWILEHIKDCHGHASPRSLVRMFEIAAQLQLSNKYVSEAILAPTFLRQALTMVSEDHVKSSLDEWPWLIGLSGRLSRWTTLRQVPMERRPFEAQIRKTWNDSWSASQSVPPCADPGDFVPMLVEIGILKERKDGRLETTDLFLDGLGFKRKGGVRRKASGVR